MHILRNACLFAVALVLAFPASSHAVDEPSGNVSGGGIGRFTSGRWGLLRGSFHNPTDKDGEVTISVTPIQSQLSGDGEEKKITGLGNDFARTVIIPPDCQRTVSWPVYMESGQTKTFSFRILVKRGGFESGDVIENSVGEPYRNFVSSNPNGRFAAENAGPSPGYCGLMTSRDLDEPTYVRLQKLGEINRRIAGKPELVLDVFSDTLHGYAESLDPLDQLIVAEPNLGQHPDTCLAIRRWVQRGGRALVLMQLCGEESCRALLGDAVPFSVVDETSMVSVPLRRANMTELQKSLRQDAEIYRREFEEPIEQIRAEFENAEVIWDVDGWPAILRVPYGHGMIYVSTISDRVLVEKRVRGGGPNSTYEDYYHECATDIHNLFLSPHEDLFVKQEDLQRAAEARIGYVIPGRTFGIAILSLFVLVMAGSAWFLYRTDRAGKLVPVTLCCAVLFGLPGVIVGINARGVAPPTIVETRLGIIANGQSEFASVGVATLYNPSSQKVDVELEKDAYIRPEGEDTRGHKRLHWEENGATVWRQFHQPAGAGHWVQSSVIRLDEPMRATGTLTKDGLLVSLTNRGQLQPQDVIIAANTPRQMAVEADGEDLICRPDAVLTPGNYSNNAILTEKQNLHADLFQKLFANKADPENPFLAQPTVLFFSESLPGGFLPRDGVRSETMTLMAVPLRYAPPKLGEEVQVPPIVIPFQIIPDLDGGVSRAYDTGSTRWVDQSDGGTTAVEFRVPDVAQPFEFSSADLLVRIRAGSRNVTLSAIVPDTQQADGVQKLVPLHSEFSPVGDIAVQIPKEVLNAQGNGNIRIAINVAEIEFKVDEEGKTEKQIADELEELKLKDNKWQFEAMQLKATGKRVSGQ